jgi:16S rRNA (cytidine1402-2'-O)-methyltransferase
MIPALYLLPVPLGDVPAGEVLPVRNLLLAGELRHFIVEEVRTARRWLRKMCPEMDIATLTFYSIDKHTRAQDPSFHAYLAPLRAGQSMGLLSEAGCPAIADPGAEIVRLAQEEGLRVVPLVGPSSILLSLMASGFNGQSFAFQGYLPIDPAERKTRLRQLEQRIYQDDQTQLFIETPFRNNKLAEELLTQLRPQTRLCIAADLTCPTEYVRTRTIAQWRGHLPDLHKRPAIFLLYK